jgi:polysaccharide export outer membrane protein
MSAITWVRWGTAVCCVLAVGGRRVSAQQPVETDPARLYMSRAKLESLLQFYEQSAASPVYGERLKARANAEGEVVQTRLRLGDFQVGDRVVVVLEGPQGLSDTLVVGPDGMLAFPEIGEVSLSGVLRSELGAILQTHVERYVRQPRLRSRSLIRIQIAGSVARPGFHEMPSETPLDQAIMVAGGPVGDVDLDGVRIERRGQRLMTGEALQAALAEGRTLDELGLQGGDRIVIPPRFALGAAEGAVRTLSLLTAIPLTVAALVALF